MALASLASVTAFGTGAPCLRKRLMDVSEMPAFAAQAAAEIEF